jgi:peptidoglycan/xylan/chitin deacetylase (PgdA/CDA1 family)
MRVQISTLLLALVAGAGGPALAQTCAPTAITPYISVDGWWSRTDAAVVSAGKQVALGPQPVSGGVWSWSGCAPGGAGREQTFTVNATCTATATYVNSCGAKTQQVFTLSVPVVARNVSVQEGLTAVLLRPSLSLAAGRTATWTLAGTDAARFRIDSATGALAFRQAPSTTSPGDADGRNDYEVTVQVSDGIRSAQAPVTVRVLPWNDGGAARLPLPLAPSEVAQPAGGSGQPGLRVLDWAGFKAALSFTFDDSQPSQIEHYPSLKAQRVRATYYINPTANWYPQWDDPTRFDAIWKDAVAQGSEIGNHTTHHCRATELTDNDAGTCAAGLGSAGAEFDDTNEYIRTRIGQPAVWTTAYPFGDTDYRAAAASRFLIGRGVGPGMVAPGTASDALNLPVTGFPGHPTSPGGDPVATFNTAVDNALGQGRWMIHLFHTVLPSTQDWGGGQDIGAVTGNMAYAKSLGTVWLDSVVNIGAYWRGQQLLKAATPSTSGGVTTWRWTLPASFPPGRKLRVVVDGGTLWQNGAQLPWDKRGYYEVSLDAQSLNWIP